jgi:hypothetical protein
MVAIRNFYLQKTEKQSIKNDSDHQKSNSDELEFLTAQPAFEQIPTVRLLVAGLSEKPVG